VGALGAVLVFAYGRIPLLVCSILGLETPSRLVGTNRLRLDSDFSSSWSHTSHERKVLEMLLTLNVLVERRSLHEFDDFALVVDGEGRSVVELGG